MKELFFGFSSMLNDLLRANKFTRLFHKSLLIVSFLFFAVDSVSAKGNYRCGVRLIFDSDGKGSLANYILTLQVKNTTGRNINGVSVIYKDEENRVLGNSLLDCAKNELGVKPGSYGECVRILQRVDGEYINSFGVNKWTEIVNSQLKGLNSIQYCEVLGFSF